MGKWPTANREEMLKRNKILQLDSLAADRKFCQTELKEQKSSKVTILFLVISIPIWVRHLDSFEKQARVISKEIPTCEYS